MAGGGWPIACGTLAIGQERVRLARVESSPCTFGKENARTFHPTGQKLFYANTGAIDRLLSHDEPRHGKEGDDEQRGDNEREF